MAERSISIMHSAFLSGDTFDKICKSLYAPALENAAWVSGQLSIWIDDTQGINIAVLDLAGNLQSQIFCKGKVVQTNEKN